MKLSLHIVSMLAGASALACGVNVNHSSERAGMGGAIQESGDDWLDQGSGTGMGGAVQSGTGVEQSPTDPELLDLIERSAWADELPEESPLSSTGSTSELEIHGDSRFTCTYTSYEGTEHIHELTAFDPQADALWPGSVVQGKSLDTGLLTPIALPRAPGEIAVSNLSVTGDTSEEPRLSRTIETPSQASVQEAIQDILDNPDADLNYAAKVAYTVERAHSLEEAAFKLGLDVEWMNGEVKTKFSQNSWSESTNLMVKLTQAYYTVSFAPPASPSQFFASSVTEEDSAPYMGPDNPPLYVSSVVYGRTLLMRVESDASETDLRAALDASLKMAGTDVDTELEVSHRQVLDNSKFTLFALGGSGDDVLQIAANGAEALPEYLQNGADFSPSSPGAPVSYTLRSLANNEATKVALSTSYTVPDCALNADQFRLHIKRLVFVDSGDRWGKGDNTWNVWFTKPNGEKVTVHHQKSQKAMKDGDDYSFDASYTITAPETLGAQFDVGYHVQDHGSGDSGDPGPKERHHTYNLSEDSWSNIGANRIDAQDGHLEAYLEYTVEPLQ